MSQEVLCPNPSCGKKYRLKGDIPPVFTCTKCGQSMDLSAFAPPPPPAATPSSRAARRGDAPRGGSVRGGAVRGGGSRNARARQEEEQDDEQRPRFEAPPKSNAALIWGSLGGLVVAVVVLILVMSGKKPGSEPVPTPAEPGATAPVAGGVPGVLPVPGLPVPGVPVIGLPTPSAGSPGPAATAPANPGSAAPSVPVPGAAPAPARGPSMAALKVWDAPAELGVTADEKERIERAVDTAIHDTGRSVQEAQAALVALNRKAIWRLVSEFKHIQDTDTFEKKDGLIRAMIVDRILRSIDGYMERHAKVLDRINPESSPDWATNLAKRWNGWLERGSWKTELKPWDPRVDEVDEGAERPPARSGAGGGGR